jgi:hypothetical protein
MHDQIPGLAEATGLTTDVRTTLRADDVHGKRACCECGDIQTASAANYKLCGASLT